MNMTPTTSKSLAHVGMRSPWGKVETVHRSNATLAFVSTAGHGGYKLSPAANKKVHEAWRRRGGWYEEDCDWVIVAVTFPKMFANPEGAHAKAKNYFPDQYEKVFGVKVTEAESYKLRERRARAENVGKFVAKTAWGDWHKDVPEGMVVVAAKCEATGEERFFRIPSDEYHTRLDNPEHAVGFVVDPAKHAVAEGFKP